MARDVSDTTPIGARSELVDWIASGEKPRDAWRLGTEHEKIPFYTADAAPVPYDGAEGIRALLEGLQARTGWAPILEDGQPIGLADDVGGGAISLEPGGQFELSGAPLRTLHETARETAQHIADAKAVGEGLGLGFLTLGMSPLWTRAETPVMPKARYRIMTNYMPKVGSLGLDMMYRTSTVQVNMDYASEADMVKKLRVSLALQPIATAIFANSPFTDGKPNGYLSMRSQIWRDTDRDRTGMMAFAFEDGFGYERYVDWVLDVPLYFVKRDATYHDVAGSSFRDLFAGKLSQLPGERATQSDWANHVSTVFPEVRLKRYLEMRGADVGNVEHIVALSAFWTGLLYDEAALDGAWELVKTWTAQEREQLRADVPKQALKASIAGRSVQDVARDALALSHEGLKRRGYLDGAGRDETRHLTYAEEIVASGRTQAERLLALFEGPWGGSVLPAFKETAF
ncbi:glutamate--cysteine ligase [Microvirga lotononidis]|uniref:Glutamate--cysteine ligase n=1 Tax=Microvirga lotononidis TaxID=864069 RepID=I4YV32_9HYPH|nr:glutamate--cysteine ligase [Microvirga lotononidis]EIM27824.1 glutamate--cysteine ligase, plant type [Microvirga lotononidis]WQO28046.1 glutamate--cysteine ligase [Microvirga lotononidis]